MVRGKYIIFSGGEGSGKSTVVNQLGERLPEALLTREPGAMPFGQAVRSLLLNSEYRLTAWTEYYLFMADRANHMETVVRPALESGRHVFSDRGFPETFAYQLFTRLQIEDPAHYLAELQDRKWPWPDLWLLLDVDPAVGLQRRRLAGGLTTFDQRDLDYHRSVQTAFHRFAKRAPFPVAVVDASQPLDQVSAEVLRLVERVLVNG